ncbi:hypothetical protein H696_05618 [Fonticula alba]|uniref:Uncharacterized protein n=1 Tax=Fonticula alba TaxID=691883 RepID=A0A058Z0V3_FONAL|nr:hypothetical protein H696_05618 [Fonticula alba]KCV67889.1 hypothetical protein H696_05618 [Fonticula alba]|eukprot:XP_009497709.1 hypothetical protein H696_05618 [Fonticula alba]
MADAGAPARPAAQQQADHTRALLQRVFFFPGAFDQPVLLDPVPRSAAFRWDARPAFAASDTRAGALRQALDALGQEADLDLAQGLLLRVNAAQADPRGPSDGAWADPPPGDQDLVPTPLPAGLAPLPVAALSQLATRRTARRRGPSAGDAPAPGTPHMPGGFDDFGDFFGPGGFAGSGPLPGDIGPDPDGHMALDFEWQQVDDALAGATGGDRAPGAASATGFGSTAALLDQVSVDQLLESAWASAVELRRSFGLPDLASPPPGRRGSLTPGPEAALPSEAHMLHPGPAAGAPLAPLDPPDLRHLEATVATVVEAFLPAPGPESGTRAGPRAVAQDPGTPGTPAIPPAQGPFSPVDADRRPRPGTRPGAASRPAVFSVNPDIVAARAALASATPVVFFLRDIVARPVPVPVPVPAPAMLPALATDQPPGGVVVLTEPTPQPGPAAPAGDVLPRRPKVVALFSQLLRLLNAGGAGSGSRPATPAGLPPGDWVAWQSAGDIGLAPRVSATGLAAQTARIRVEISSE